MTIGLVKESVSLPTKRPFMAKRFVAAVASIAGAALIALPTFMPTYVVTLATEALMAGVFASGINLLVGTTGLVSLGQAMFLGLGGYGIGIGCSILGLPLWLSVLGSLLFVAVTSVAIGSICVRTKGIEFLLITLAFSQLIYGVAIKLRITNGSDGMSGIPRPDLSSLGVSADDPKVFYYYVFVVASLMILILWRIRVSPFGSVLSGIRENERRSIAMGYAVQQYKLGAFVVSAVFCATAGILQAQYTYFVNPDFMSWQSSGEGVLMVIIGGSSAVLGPMVGAAIYVLVKQGLSLLTTEYLMVFGIFFMLVVVLFRDGVFETARRIWGSTR